jgi:transposase
MGGKWHILVDTHGNLVTVIVPPATIADRDGVDRALEAAIETSQRLRHVRADRGCTGIS